MGSTTEIAEPPRPVDANKATIGRSRGGVPRCCLTAALERWNWETESVALLNLYGDLTQASWAGLADLRR